MVLITSDSGSGDSSVMAGVFFTTPFEDGINYTITSEFGDRKDPFDGTQTFHSGIDLSAPDGTNIVASGDGVVVEIGFQEEGLGNYVYIEHNYNGVIFYSAYGHMLDDSIVVSEGEQVTAKQKIGVIGSTGKSTGTHLHFTLMSPNLKFDKDNLVNPINVINGLD